MIFARNHPFIHRYKPACTIPKIGTDSLILFHVERSERDAQMSDGNEILNQTAQGQLKSIIERIERLEQEKSEIAEQIKEVFSEAKGNGFDVAILRKVIAVRKLDAAKRQEVDAILDLYLSALGMV